MRTSSIIFNPTQTGPSAVLNHPEHWNKSALRVTDERKSHEQDSAHPRHRGAFTNVRRIIKMRCCSHLFEISNVIPKTPTGCEECLKIGDQWLHLRLCMTCGHVGCCDDSKNTHARKHFHSTNHPFIKSFESGEDWGWCYIDELLFESFPGSLTTQWCGVLGASH